MLPHIAQKGCGVKLQTASNVAQAGLVWLIELSDSLGTNLPSMTSTWTHCAPASTTAVTCSSQIDHAQHSKGICLAEAFSRLPSFG